MTWYITIHSRQTLATSDTRHLVEFLKTLPELRQLQPVCFANVQGLPWVDVTIATTSQSGGWSSDGKFISQFDRVELACSGRDPRQDWYDGLAIRIAKFLGWTAIEEQAGRVIWPVAKG
ncbi:hypothetical protein [Rhizobium sp. LEGMi135b]